MNSILGCLILLDSVLAQGGGQSVEVPSSPRMHTDNPIPEMIMFNSSTQSPPPTVVEEKIRLVAFGDWGDVRHIDLIDNINEFIRTNNPDGVLLLGDNFYPTGIDPDLGLDDPKFELFTHHLAENLPPSLPFYAVLGNNDVLKKTGYYQVEFTHINSNWNMLSEDFYLVRFPGDICVWSINSNAASKSASVSFDAQIEQDLAEGPCRWRIFTAHYPMLTAGAYRKAPAVRLFRTYFLPLVQKHSIDFVITGHDHTSQVIQMEDVSHSIFLVSGAAVDVRTDAIDRSSVEEIPGGGRLIWGDDSQPNTILSLEFSSSIAQYKFLHLTDSGEFDELFSGEKQWDEPVGTVPELMRLSSVPSGPLQIVPSGKYDD